MNEVAIRFSRNLVAARKKAGLTQEEIAFRAALHRTEIGLLERCARVPRIDTLAKLAGALGIRPEDLLAGIRWRPGDYRPGGFEESGGEEER
jgi:transcriptional regulator with XRE-family HTH domain